MIIDVSENITQPLVPSEQSYYLSDILGASIIAHGKKIGKLADLLIVETEILPEVIDIYVTRSFGNPSLIIPIDKVKIISDKEIVVEIDPTKLEKYEKEPSEENDILLKDHIMDKKVLDTEDREVEVVYDVKVTMKDNKLVVSDVDLSKYRLLKRLGLKSLGDIFYQQTGRPKSRTVSWNYIQHLVPKEIGRLKGEVKLKVLKERLSDIYPVDLADILEQLDPQQRIMIFNELENGHAVDTLEEIDPNVQRVIISSLKKEKVAQMLDKMTPAQAADILSVLPYSEVRTILKLLENQENVEKIKAILERQEQNILNFTTTKILKFSPEKTVEEAEEEYYQVARGKEVVMYLYIMDENDKLLGVIDIKELLQAKEEMRLKDIMTEHVISLNPMTTLKQAMHLFSRYGFRAIPVTDKNHKLLGVVPYKDVKNFRNRIIG